MIGVAAVAGVTNGLGSGCEANTSEPAVTPGAIFPDAMCSLEVVARWIADAF